MEIERDAGIGETKSERLLEVGLRVLAVEPGARLDYLKIVSPETLDEISDIQNGALVAIAAWVGSTRLIDNLLLKPR